jgi:REP element-mobilizing transposase RayT
MPTRASIDASYRRHLPHLRYSGATYFVTWRLHRDQPPLRPTERTLVADALRYFDGERYDLYAYVVMPDHVHVLVRPLAPFALTPTLFSWKGFTANRLQRLHARAGVIWQHESYDRVVRSERGLQYVVRYIVDNPPRRWPGLDSYAWIGMQVEISTGERGGSPYARLR